MASTSPSFKRPATASGPERSRLESCIQFAEDAPWFRDIPLATAFKAALCDALRSEDVGRLRVRCSVTRGDGNELRFMCKVDLGGDLQGSGPASYAWSWWSPLADSPDELVSELRRALRTRHDRLVGESAEQRPPRTDKERGPLHGTWSTAPWDLGHGDTDESFCRNRRGRWTSEASSPPLRPRHPR